MDKQQELLDLLSKAYDDPKINEYEGLKISYLNVPKD